MNIVFITSDEMPGNTLYGDIGYIADLSQYIAHLNQNVILISPLFNKTAPIESRKLLETFLNFAGENYKITVYKTTIGCVNRIYIDNCICSFNGADFKTIGKQCLFFNYAACEIISRLFPESNIVFTDSTPCTASQVYMKYREDRAIFKKMRKIHLLNTLKEKSTTDLENLGFSKTHDEATQICRLKGKIDLNRGAVICADRVILPSVSYGEDLRSESKEPRYCHTIRQFAFKFKGITKGINYKAYDPSHDISLKSTYSAENPDGKIENKLYIQKLLGWDADKNIPLISMFCSEKSDIEYSLLTGAMPSITANGAQIIICIGKNQKSIDTRNHENKNVKIIETSDIAVKNRILAGSDIYICVKPSAPSGLEVKKACRYGTVPVAFSTGALRDSITYYDRRDHSGNGFTFNTYNTHDMLYTLWDALCMLRNEPEHWERVIRNAMKCDFSIERNARELIDYISQ